MPHDVRYNQGLRHYEQHPTVREVLPRGVSDEKRVCVLGQVTGSLPEWNLGIKRVHFVGPIAQLYWHE